MEQQAFCIPGYLENLKLTAENEKGAVREILRSLLQIDEEKVIKEKNWQKEITGALTKKLTREYVNDILIAEILGSGNKSDLAMQLLSVCISDLQRRVLDNLRLPLAGQDQCLKNLVSMEIFGISWQIFLNPLHYRFLIIKLYWKSGTKWSMLSGML